MFRTIENQLIQVCSEKQNDVIVLLGSRQVGKTTLLKNIFPHAVYVNIEKGPYATIFNSHDISKIKSIFEEEKKYPTNILILDEVQRLTDPGLIAKLIHDELPEIHLIISGSSALEIAHKASESLAGRKKSFYLFPLTYEEKLIQSNTSNSEIAIKESMRYGMYPELLNRPLEKESYLLELVDSVILKDVYYLNLVKNTKHLLNLLRLLAYQIGQQINISDLSTRIGSSRQTILDYLEILKKTYIIFTLPPFTKKRRDEIGKTEKIFFYDLGMRNAIINDFSPVEFRVDFGNIFENFIMSEIIKLNIYYQLRYSIHYWRTKWGSEVDCILQKDNDLHAIEIKIRKGTVSPAFKNTYPQSTESIINMKETYSFLQLLKQDFY
ncbi:MAG: ATP-binding protein [bacterium]|nr:ATP-binding protein [bacterium]